MSTPDSTWAANWTTDTGEPAKFEDTYEGSQAFRREARAYLGIWSSCPVVVTGGDSPPTLEGEEYHYTTPGGAPVYHPNAYRRAWGKPVYHASTLRVEVGQDWRACAALPVRPCNCGDEGGCMAPHPHTDWCG